MRIYMQIHAGKRVSALLKCEVVLKGGDESEIERRIFMREVITVFGNKADVPAGYMPEMKCCAAVVLAAFI